MNVGVVSLGCSKNRVDSEFMMGSLTDFGYNIVNDPDLAEIIIVNTCGFIQSAKEESIETVLEMAEKKQTAKCKILVMTGCLSQRYKAELKEELPEVDIMLGVDEYDKLIPMLKSIAGSNPVCDDIEHKRMLTTPHYYAYLKIAEGCDNRCSFCAIPSIRGRYVSREFDDIIKEAKELVNNGVKELIIIAQDTSRYGLDLYKKKRLAQLLNELSKTDVKWIRLLYAYPEDFDDELIDVLAYNEKIVKYIDIPTQHGDDNLLKSMNRKGSSSQILDLVKKLRAKNSDFVLRTSFIVGFPGESEQQFLNLVEFAKKAKFERAGVFIYSQEDGTKAAQMQDQIDEAIKEDRHKRLMLCEQEISQQFNNSRIGKEYECLVVDYDKQEKMYALRSYAEAPEIDGFIFLKTNKKLNIGDFVNIRITKALAYDMIGELIDESAQ